MELKNNINHPGFRDVSRFTYPLNYVKNIDEFEEKLIYTSSSWTIANGNNSIDIELHLKKAKPKTLVVMLGGAKVETDYGKEGPFFLGRRFSKSINANILFISCPTFSYDKDIKLGWYLGTKENPAQEKITELISIIMKKFEINFLVFFGGSGGGFASMYQSSKFTNSLALVWNPQINVVDYNTQWVLKETCELAFKCHKSELSNYVTTDVTSLYKNNQNNNKVLYWQNLTDRHVVGQLNPFLNQLDLPIHDKEFCGWNSDWLFLFLTNLSKGHSSPDKNILLKLLQKITIQQKLLSNDEYEKIFKEIVSEELSLRNKVENIMIVEIKNIAE